MQKLAEICVKRPVFATMLVMAMVVAGVFSYMTLGVDLYPNVDLPMVTVTTTDFGASPEEMETEVTDRIEAAVSAIPGLDTITSTSAEGTSVVVAIFALDMDGRTATQNVSDKVNQIADLPATAQRPLVAMVDTGAAPIMQIAVSGDRPLSDVTRIADEQIKRTIQHLDGIGNVEIVGGTDREISVLLDPHKMLAYEVTVDELQAALLAANIEAPGGRLVEGPTEVAVRTMGRIEGPAQVAGVPVTVRGNYVVRVGDVATVVSGYAEQTSAARLNGNPAVMLQVTKQSGGNTVSIADGVKAELDKLQASVPGDVRIEVVSDQSIFIRAAVDAIKEHMILGGLLAAFIVWLFLRNARTTLIAALAIPTSIIATFTFMSIADYTLNQITMLALTLMIGIVIDDAIVVMENIFRFVDEKGLDPVEATIEATREIGFAVMATTLSLLAVFLPVAFMSGIVGKYMASFGLTAAFAIAVSLIVSFTLTPMLSARWIKPGEGVAGEGTTRQHGLYRVVEKNYLSLLEWSLAHRAVIVVVTILTVALTVPILSALPKNFLPSEDESEFQITFTTAEGSTMPATLAVAERIAGDLREVAGVAATLTSVGGGFVPQNNSASMLVKLVPIDERSVSQDQIMVQARDIISKVPAALGSSVEPFQVISTGATRNAAVQFVVTGPDLDKLAKYADELMKELEKVPGIIDPDTSAGQPRSELQVRIDRGRAADLGVSVEGVSRAVNVLMSGSQVGSLQIGTDQVPIRLRAAAQFRESEADLLDVPLTSKAGTTTLANVATLQRGNVPSTISRYQRQRQVTVLGDLGPGGSQQAAVTALTSYAATMEFDPGYTAGPMGASQQLQQAATAFLMAISLSLIFMYMVLASQFESFGQPIVILLTLPMVVPMGFFSLLLAGQSLNLFSALGLILLFGIVKKNAILQIDHANYLIRNKGMERHAAIMQANKDRLRPILMTTLALVAGMLPLTLSSGVGSGSNRSIGSLVVGGQSLCLLLTLVAVPVFSTIFDDIGAAGLPTRLGKTLRLWLGRGRDLLARANPRGQAA